MPELTHIDSTVTRFAQSAGPVRSYTVSGGGRTMVKVLDEATPYMQYLARTFPDEMNRALRHVGWWSSMLLKAEFAAGAPGGRRFAGSPGYGRFRVLDWYRGRSRGPRDAEGNLRKQPGERRRKRRGVGSFTKLGRKVRAARGGGDQPGHTGQMRPIGGGLIRAVGYQWKRSQHRVDVGWLSASARHLGYIFQRGKTTTMTPKMHRFFWAAGVLPKEVGSVIEQPARPVMDPFFARHRGDMVNRLERRVEMLLREKYMKRAMGAYGLKYRRTG